VQTHRNATLSQRNAMQHTTAPSQLIEPDLMKPAAAPQHHVDANWTARKSKSWKKHNRVKADKGAAHAHQNQAETRTSNPAGRMDASNLQTKINE